MTMNENYDVVMINIADIYRDDSFNSRGEITTASVLELAKDIKARGLDQPIAVMPYNKDGYKYKIIAGHRRYTACKHLNMKQIPCFIREKCSDLDASVMNLNENIQRMNLNIYQEAQGVKNMAACGYTPRQIASALNQGLRWVNIRLALLRLPKNVQQAAAAGLIIPREIEILADLKESGRPEEDLIKFANTCSDRRQAQSSVTTKILKAIKRASRPSVLRLRDKNEIEEILDTILGATKGTPTLATYALGWALGGMTTYDLLTKVKEEAELLGYNYTVPHVYYQSQEAEKREYNID